METTTDLEKQAKKITTLIKTHQNSIKTLKYRLSKIDTTLKQYL